MYDRLIFENFFNKERQNVLTDIEREIALSLITTKQTIHAEPIANNPLVNYHLDLSLPYTSLYRTLFDRKLRQHFCIYIISHNEKKFIFSALSIQIFLNFCLYVGTYFLF